MEKDLNDYSGSGKAPTDAAGWGGILKVRNAKKGHSQGGGFKKRREGSKKVGARSKDEAKTEKITCRREA